MPDWAAPEIRTVTHRGVLGSSATDFRPQASLTQGALAGAIARTDSLQHSSAPQPATAGPLAITSTIGAGATIGGQVRWVVDAPGRDIEQVAFAIDGVGHATALSPPFAFDLGAGVLDTTTLPDGAHQLAVKVSFAGSGSAIAVWDVTVDNAAGRGTYGAGAPADVPVVKSEPPPTAARASAVPQAPPVLYRAGVPARPVTIKELDAALVAYLGLDDAAREIQHTLAEAGLRPPPHTGSESVARMLGLRLNHPAREDSLELLPGQPATRAEAAWSFAQVLRLNSWSIRTVQHAADTFTLPKYSPWQRRILTTAVSYVGYPYVWGGTSPDREVDFGVPAVGGFDCSGFVWRIYKLTPYPRERDLADVINGRTTYVMSGEVPHRDLIPIGRLQPADVMFFGPRGPRSTPSIVGHTAVYLGGNWLIQSSDEGVTLVPFAGWYRRSFAWARRPLRETGLAG